MNHVFLKRGLLLAALFLCGATGHAQFGNLLQKAKDKAAQKASDAMDKKTSGSTAAPAPATTSAPADSTPVAHKRLTVESTFDFVPADSVLYASNFDKANPGVLPPAWKTNGSGELVKIAEVPGVWLQLQQSATYKLKQNLYMPANCTVEFDILTSCDKVDDIYPLEFGFAENNSVSSRGEGDIAHVALQYYNRTEVQTFAGPVNEYNNTRFDLQPYANDKMHVSITMSGNNMKVYLEKTKVLDAKMFLDGVKKYFFISAPMQFNHDAKIFISNVRIAK